jgi:hypothetical protein
LEFSLRLKIDKALPLLANGRREIEVQFMKSFGEEEGVIASTIREIKLRFYTRRGRSAVHSFLTTYNKTNIPTYIENA